MLMSELGSAGGAVHTHERRDAPGKEGERREAEGEVVRVTRSGSAMWVLAASAAMRLLPLPL